MEKGRALHLNKLESPSPKNYLCQVDWNWPSGSGEKDFLNLSMYFRNFVIISPWKRARLFIWANLNPLQPKMNYAKFGWNWLRGSGEDFWKFVNVNSIFPYYLPLEKGGALLLNKLEFPSPKDYLCQVWLKLTQWFWRGRFLKFVNAFSQFYNYLPLEKNWPFVWTILNPIYPRMICANLVKIGSAVLENIFTEKLSMYFCNFVIVSPWKRMGPWIPFTQRWFVPSFVEIGPVVLENKMKMWKVYDEPSDHVS